MLDSPPEEPESPQPTAGTKGTAFFVLATICSFPFVLVSGFIALTFFFKKSASADLLGFSAFFLPLMLVAAIGAVIFIVLAGTKGRPCYRPFLALYSFSILIYWMALISSGPW